jgi:ABC-2 type transport system ATP-binding protein
VIAEGTSEELKDKIGGEVLELHVAADALARAAETLRGLGAGEPTTDEETRLIRVPVGSDGPTVLLETVRRLDDAGIPIEDIALHRPTLDDVFLSLTGHAAELAIGEEEEPESEPAKRRMRKDR